VTTLSDNSLAALLDRVASGDPAPGAGPSVGWTCAFAAALVEMVSAVALRTNPPHAVRGEATTAAVLAEAVVRAGIPLIELNLAGAAGDPRCVRVHELAEGARADLDRAMNT
jgi:hypothetical protein